MSAPDTNIKKQASRHRGPLIGIVAAVVLAIVLLLWLLTDTFSDTASTSDGPTTEQIDSGGIPAEGSPNTSMSTGNNAPQVIEAQPGPNTAPSTTPDTAPQSTPVAPQ